MARLLIVVLAAVALCAAEPAAGNETAACHWAGFWYGCQPKPDCKHKMKVRWGKLGDCVARNSSSVPAEPAKAAAEEPTPAEAVPAEEATPTEDAPAEEAPSEEAPAEEAPAEKDEP